MDQVVVPHDTLWFTVMTVISLTAGTAFIMWLGEKITDRGIGNGISLIIFAGIVARLPSATSEMYTLASQEVVSIGAMMGLAAFVALVVVIVVYVEKGYRRVPVQYAKRMIGRRQYGGTSTYLPLKVNQAGVIPVIFASSVLYIPQLISQLTSSSTSGFQRWVNNYLINQQSAVYISIYFAMIIFFAYFYVSITFNPEERAEDMKKYGGFIPGIRPGRPRAGGIDRRLDPLQTRSRIRLTGVLAGHRRARLGRSHHDSHPFADACICHRSDDMLQRRPETAQPRASPRETIDAAPGPHRDVTRSERNQAPRRRARTTSTSLA